MSAQIANLVIISLIFPAILALCAWITRLIAQNKGYDGAQGMRAGLFLGVFAIAVYLILPERTEPKERPAHDIVLSLGLCPKCAEETQIYEGFCTVCGTRVDTYAAAATSRPAKQHVATAPVGDEELANKSVAGPADSIPDGEQPDSAVPEAICTSCGQKARFFEGFCTNCGARMGTPAAVAERVAPASRSAAGIQPAVLIDDAMVGPGTIEPRVTEKLCPGCGMVSRFEEGVCTVCGARAGGAV